MPDYTIRSFQSIEDARLQYELWLRATQSLPRAWRSCLQNVQYQLRHGAKYPRCRLYAERPDGTLLGYIGTHPPFEWHAAQHGPPTEPLGWAIPFGFPWTAPFDATLQDTLYDEMIRLTPEVYRDSPRDIYIQRFRASWSEHLAFLEQRGWRRHARIPLLGREISSAGSPPTELTPVTRADLPLVAALCETDDTAEDKPSMEQLQQRLDGGWITGDAFWRWLDQGAFALECRGPWAAVTFFCARSAEWDQTLNLATAQASALGAREIYFTAESHQRRLSEALRRQGFDEVDAGVYYVRDAD